MGKAAKVTGAVNISVARDGLAGLVSGEEMLGMVLGPLPRQAQLRDSLDQVGAWAGGANPALGVCSELDFSEAHF